MSTYAFVKDVENYIEGWVTDDPFALERLIRRAERDIEKILVRANLELPPTQIISIIGAASGTYQLNFNGQLTSLLTYNASAAAIQAALQLLPAIGTNNVTVLGTNPFTVVWDLGWVTANYLSQTNASSNFNVPILTVVSNLSAGSSTPVDVEMGRKLNPITDIDDNQVIALSNATCAQVEYRNAMGEGFFVRAQFTSVRGPDFTTSGKLPIIGPKARRELSQVGLIKPQGRALAAWGRRGVARGWPTY